MRCPHCQSGETVKNGTATLKDGSTQQRYGQLTVANSLRHPCPYLCRGCGKRFNERTNTPMARLRTSSQVVAAASNVRSEGLGVRATGRSFGKSHSTIINWEQRLAAKADQWSPPAPQGADVTREGDEGYTRVGENLPPSESEGWTIHFVERESRSWVDAQAGQRRNELFEQGTQAAWAWSKPAQFIRWFTDGERRYGLALWKLASVWLKRSEVHPSYQRRKGWRQGLEVAMTIKGSQGRRRVVWVKPEASVHRC